MAKFWQYQQIKIEYTPQGQPLKVINLTDKKDELKFLYKDGFLKQIQVNRQKVGFEFDYAPNSLHNEKEKDMLLSCLSYLNGVEENFRYKRIPNKERHIYIENTAIPVSDCLVNRLAYGNNGDNWLEWDEDTELALQDSSGKYAIIIRIWIIKIRIMTKLSLLGIGLIEMMRRIRQSFINKKTKNMQISGKETRQRHLDYIRTAIRECNVKSII